MGIYGHEQPLFIVHSTFDSLPTCINCRAPHMVLGIKPTGLSQGTVTVSGIRIFKKRFYVFIRERHTERQRHRRRKKQAPCREPDAGLDPRTWGS